MRRQIWTIVLLSFLLLSACAAPAAPAAPVSQASDAPAVSEETHTDEGDHLPELAALNLAEGEKLQVVATTNLVADVVGQIGGDAVDLRSLLPPGADPPRLSDHARRSARHQRRPSGLYQWAGAGRRNGIDSGGSRGQDGPGKCGC